MEMYKKMAEIYDLVYQDVGGIRFWNHTAHKYGGPVLELGCGTGRILLELAKAGFEVSGIDNSPDMLAVLKKNLKKLPKGAQEEIKVKEADMRNFSLDRMFRTVIIPFSSFQHLLNIKEQEACLQSIKRHLLPEGALIIDVFNPDLSRPERMLRHDTTVKDAGRTISKFSTQTFNKTLQTTNAHFFIDITEKAGAVKRITTDFKLKYFFHKELRQLLEKNGFRVIETYGDYNQERFSEKDRKKIIIVAKKAG
ncbi:MAG: class I SAM-dependent methyltransferase [Candidatus Aenigmatarchaeota archaeon]